MYITTHNIVYVVSGHTCVRGVSFVYVVRGHTCVLGVSVLSML